MAERSGSRENSQTRKENPGRSCAATERITRYHTSVTRTAKQLRAKEEEARKYKEQYEEVYRYPNQNVVLCPQRAANTHDGAFSRQKRHLQDLY